MEKYDPLKSELADLERALRDLTPESPRLTSQQIVYQAGVTAGERQLNRWRPVAAIALALSAYAFVSRLHPSIAKNDPVADRPPQSQPETDSFNSSTAVAASYLRLRDDVVRDGWDALPPGSGGGNVEPSATVLSMQ
jgi:hypothetical protein